MGYFIITDSNWAKLRNEILSLAEICHKAFGEQSRHTDWLHNGDVCQLLNISKRTLQHYRDTGVCCPLPKSGISATTSVRMWSDYWKPNQRKQKRIKLKSTNKHEDYGTGKRLEHGCGRYAGGAVRYQRSKQEN